MTRSTERPSLVVATVDKFARIPFKGQTRTLFGLRDRYSPTYGHISEADGDSVGGRKLRDAGAAPRLLPPELIIQDELHLISGPLGTMVGLYETVVEYASSLMPPGATRIPAKVIASTATIRRAAQQTHQLYGGRRLAIFPPSGLTARDSFFAREMAIDPETDSSAGRLYVGVNTPGSSTKTLLVRVYSDSSWQPPRQRFKWRPSDRRSIRDSRRLLQQHACARRGEAPRGERTTSSS